MNKNSTTKSRSKGKSANSIPPFLHKIYEILENSSYNDLVSWNEDGNAFIIKNVTEFTEKVLPNYFKHSNFASFVRQLNLYDFHKSRYENNGNEFYHKLFKRGEKQLLAEIKRKMPNENAMDSPSQFLQPAEELEAERVPPGYFQNPMGLQELINRQDRLENAVKLLSTQNKQLIKENKVMWTEMTSLKAKQSNTEKATRMITGQNNQLLKENRCLWGDLILNREKYEKQVEKLFIFLISVLQCQRNNPRNIFKKKNYRGATINTNSEEDHQIDEPAIPKTDNNPFSVLPMKKIAKFLNNKKAQSQLDKLLECLEQEGIQSLFNNKAFSFDEKDLSVQLSSLLDRDIEKPNLHSVEFLGDKRPPPIDHILERENPREVVSKSCKVEGPGDWNSTVAIMTEEPNAVEKLRVSKKPSIEGFSFLNKIVDVSSPMQIETSGCEFDLSPLNLRHHLNPIEDNFLQIPENLFSRHFLPHDHFSEDEGDDENKNKNENKEVASLQPMLRSRSASQQENHQNQKGGSSKMEEILSWLNQNELFHEISGSIENDPTYTNATTENSLTFGQHS